MRWKRRERDNSVHFSWRNRRNGSERCFGSHIVAAQNCCEEKSPTFLLLRKTETVSSERFEESLAICEEGGERRFGNILSWYGGRSWKFQAESIVRLDCDSSSGRAIVDTSGRGGRKFSFCGRRGRSGRKEVGGRWNDASRGLISGRSGRGRNRSDWFPLFACRRSDCECNWGVSLR